MGTGSTTTENGSAPPTRSPAGLDSATTTFGAAAAAERDAAATPSKSCASAHCDHALSECGSPAGDTLFQSSQRKAADVFAD